MPLGKGAGNARQLAPDRIPVTPKLDGADAPAACYRAVPGHEKRL
jgi:hypothetical protein